MLVLVAGCGGGSSNGKPKQEAPDATDIEQIGSAYAGVGLGCLSPGGADDAALESHVDVLIEEYGEAGGDATFKLAPSAPTLTMREALQDARDQLRNCAEAGVSGRAPALAERINGVLDGTP